MFKTVCVMMLASVGFSFAEDFQGESAPLAPSSSSFGGSSNFFLGGGVEYFVDEEDEFYSGHFGYDFGDTAIFLELGWVGEDSGGVSVDLFTFTANYKKEVEIADRFNFYVGGGAGIAFLDGDYHVPLRSSKVSLDDQAFALQGFAGLVYELADNFEIYGGARYLLTTDFELNGFDIDGFDDLSIGAGIRFNF